MGKNILVGLSGGPSAAINSSLAGVIAAAKRSSYGVCYGAQHGIEGVLQERLIDLAPYSDEESLRLLRQTPAMAIGSCRKRLTEADYPQVDRVLEKYDIGVLFYIGGNDSMDTVEKLSRRYREQNRDIQVIGIPKTIDNDLPLTDHTPGFGSAARYLYHTMHEIIQDSEIYPVKNVVIVEVMGRDSGWLTLAAAMPRFLQGGAPQIVAIPEVPFDEYGFIERLRELLFGEHSQVRTVVCAISEGIRDKSGNYVGMETKSGKTDTFGHAYLSGVGKYLEGLVSQKLGCKVRSIELNVLQRCAAHLASKTDLDEAFSAGEEAVRAAQEGKSGVMMVFRRISDSPYQMKIETAGVEQIANLARDVPERWWNYEEKEVQGEIIRYLMPLMNGEVELCRDETGLPRYIQIKK